MTVAYTIPLLESETPEGLALSEDIALKLWAATMTLTAVLDSVMREPSLSEQDACRIRSMQRPFQIFCETFLATYPPPTFSKIYESTASEPLATSSPSPSPIAPRTSA